MKLRVALQYLRPQTFVGLTTILSAIATLAATLADLGIKEGAPYADAKSRLVKLGWTATVDAGPHPVPSYTEISCGQGVDAVCSVGFKKGPDTLALVVKTTKRADGGTGWIVAGEY